MGDNDKNQAYIETDIENFGNGVLAQLFDENHAKILRNILDPSTEPTTMRKLTIEIAYRPSKDRRHVSFRINATNKLAQLPSFDGIGFIVQEKGKVMLMQDNPDQQKLEFQEAGIVPIKKEAGTK